MKYIKKVFDTAYGGTEQIEYCEIDSNRTDKEINDEFYGWEVEEKCEGYSYLVNGWDEEITDEELEQFFDECRNNSNWEYITKEEYDENA